MKTKLEKDWFGRLKSKEEVHDDSQKWLSEIDFVYDEMRFLDHLLGSNYIDFIEHNLSEKVEKLIEAIKTENNNGNVLRKLILEHERILSDLIKTDSVTSNTHYLDTHKSLEFEMILFNKKYKKLKRHIFALVENVSRKKEQKKLIKH